jgi:RNA polymerase sigma-70 factor (ECF subfamily)
MLMEAGQTRQVVSEPAAVSRDAFAAVVRKNQAMVYGLACHFLHDRAVAEELAQEVFLELYSALPALESDAHVTNWLRRVATHRCIDYARRARSRPQVPLEDVAEPASPSAPADPLLLDRLRKLTASLPERARAVLLLRYQEDMEPSEIAATLNMPVNTVKSHLQRSLAMLREKLERTGVRS